MLDPEPAEVKSLTEKLVGQDVHIYDGCYAHLPHSDMLEKTHWLGCMGSEELVDRDTEKGAEQSALNLVDLLGLEEGCELENEESW